MVTEVSAMLVLTTILRQPGGMLWNTAFCSCEDSEECSGRMRTFECLLLSTGEAFSASMTSAPRTYKKTQHTRHTLQKGAEKQN
jgi:hypothetical protein